MGFPGTGASIRSDGVAKARARSFCKAVILFTLILVFDKISVLLSLISSIEEKPSATSSCPNVSSNSKFFTKFQSFL